MINRAEGDLGQIEVSSCSSGSEDLPDSDEEELTFEQRKKHFDLKVIAKQFFLKRDYFIFK